MTVRELHAAYGYNWSECMRELKLGCNTYKRWLVNGYIPHPMQLRIEALTNGKLKADVEKG